MRAYVRENWKIMAAITLFIGFVVGFAAAGELSAKNLQTASELSVVSCELEQTNYVHDGQPKKPKIINLVFCNEQNESVKVKPENINIIKYKDNVRCGNADIVITINGYQGEIILQDVFQIRPAKPENLKITSSSKESMELSWEKVEEADGYFIYKNSNTGLPGVAERIEGADHVTYTENNIQTNAIYTYYVKAYVLAKNKDILSNESNVAIQATPLETAVLTGASSATFSSVYLQWNEVPGASGYQIYRSEKNSGEYTCISEIQDGKTVSLTDTNCECGKEYFYYIRACQKIDDQVIYGEHSPVLSVTVTPDKVTLNGGITQDRTEVTLSWKPSQGAQGYELYRKIGSGSYELIKKYEGNDPLTFTDSKLSTDMEYKYRVRAYCVVEGKQINSSYSNVFTKKVIIVFNYTPGEISANMAKVLEFQGTPYVYGGKDPRGWDCSGFTSWVMQNCFGVTIPKSAAGQASSGQAVSISDRGSWQPGDILCYTDGGRFSHVAMYIGNGQMIHALNKKRGTFIQSVDQYEGWDSNTLTRVRRFF